jgi:prepilin-type N-terminal cleavage/methylation domain-containing protein
MRFTDRLRDERGMTMIELLVAAVICAVGIVATVGVMDQSRQVSVKSEYRDTMAHQAERELEKLMELPWANFSHGAVAPSVSPYSGTPAGGTFGYDRNNPGTTETLVTSAVNGQVPSTFTAWTDNQTRLSGRVYRFVTRIDTNSRRLTIVVTADGVNPPPALLLSSIKTQPIT